MRVRSEPPALRARSRARVQSRPPTARVLDQGACHGIIGEQADAPQRRRSSVLRSGPCRELWSRPSAALFAGTAPEGRAVSERNAPVRFATPARPSPLPWRSQPSRSPQTSLSLCGWRCAVACPLLAHAVVLVALGGGSAFLATRHENRDIFFAGYGNTGWHVTTRVAQGTPPHPRPRSSAFPVIPSFSFFCGDFALTKPRGSLQPRVGIAPPSSAWWCDAALRRTIPNPGRGWCGGAALNYYTSCTRAALRRKH